MLNDDLITITEAAQRLKVSERTIYRMLRSGKLTRRYQYDTVRLMSDEVNSMISNRMEYPSKCVGHMSENVPGHLHKQLDEKDAQISQLLERQREMGQMLERLQEQLYELTRYVLSKTEDPSGRGMDWAFWRPGRRIDEDSSEENP